MAKEINYSLDNLITVCETYITEPERIEKITKAYNYAKLKHDSQIRKSGDEYFTHCVATALILTSVFADSDSIVAGLLHDVLEDCHVEKSELEEEFGIEVANLVYGVTKLGRLNFSTSNDYLIDYYKKIIVGMSEDVRIIIIKLADRLHNMRTLWALGEDEQKKIAKETLEIFAPIAHHLGMYKIKGDLEDLSLRYLKPDVFYDIVEKLANTKLERDKVVADMRYEVTTLLNDHHIHHEIKGRAKSIFSIYKKLDKGRKFSDIYDLLALRILVDTEQECYLALGLIHSKFRPIPKRFKDYIAMTKTNGYQSLHTTVFGEDGQAFEIQIRTYEMDEIAENGVAAHWAYKEAGGNVKTNTTTERLQFFKTILELNNDKLSDEEFVNSVKDDILSNNIYVFTPKGDVFELPKGATPIDFAYKIHSKVGEQLVGAIVNNNIVPLTYELKTNDIVKINTNKTSTPSQEWINIAKLTTTKNKIRSYFTKNEKEINIEKGRYNIEKELRRRKLSINDFLSNENLQIIYKELKINELDDLYLGLGNGKFQTNSVINIIHKREEDEPIIKKVTSIKDIDADIIVAGIDNVKVGLANCCNPLPGDNIIGYITKGSGITVHRKRCHNVMKEDERTIPVSWNDNPHKKYPTVILIKTSTRENKLTEILQIINKFDVGIADTRSLNRGDELVYEIKILAKDKEHAENILTSVQNLKYVFGTERVLK